MKRMEFDIRRVQPFVRGQFTPNRGIKKFERMLGRDAYQPAHQLLGVLDDAAPSPAAENSNVNADDHNKFLITN